MDTDQKPIPKKRDAPSAERVIRVVRMLALWGTITLCAALTVLYLLISDRTWWGELITIWPPLLWLFGLIPLAAIAFDPRRARHSLIPIIAVLLFAMLTAPWRITHRPFVSDTYRLATWNVAGSWPHDPQLMDALHDLRLDLILFQETPDGSSPEAIWPHLEHWIDIGDCAILSRWPMRELPTRDVGPWEEPLVVAIDELGVAVINVRMMLPSLRLNVFSSDAREQLRHDHRIRLAQFEELADLVETLEDGGHAVILAGDFNTPGRMASLDPIRVPLRDVWPLAGRGWGGTATNSFPMARIDQCWVSMGITPMRAEVEALPHSDHRMLMVNLAVGGRER